MSDNYISNRIILMTTEISLYLMLIFCFRRFITAYKIGLITEGLTSNSQIIPFSIDFQEQNKIFKIRFIIKKIVFDIKFTCIYL